MPIVLVTVGIGIIIICLGYVAKRVWNNMKRDLEDMLD